VIWGALHGVFILALRGIEYLRAGSGGGVAGRSPGIVGRTWRILLTFNLISFAWIFFRVPTITDAGTILRRMVGPSFWNSPPLPAITIGYPAYTAAGLNIAFIVVAMLFLAEWLYARHRRLEAPAPAIWARWLGYYALIVVIIWLGSFGSRTFIYYQF
jgi:D-alanyl-lipoteichoic acid acyltransferase DltB (MBOAT superfamily)